MILELDLEPGLEHLTDHTGQQAAVTRQLDTLGAGPRDQLLGPLAHRRVIRQPPTRRHQPVSSVVVASSWS